MGVGPGVSVGIKVLIGTGVSVVIPVNAVGVASDCVNVSAGVGVLVVIGVNVIGVTSEAMNVPGTAGVSAVEKAKAASSPLPVCHKPAAK
jgi:hypothetical protein